MSEITEVRHTGCSKRLSSKAAADVSTGGVAPGYVEDAFEARTPLADFFSILLKVSAGTRKDIHELDTRHDRIESI